MFRDIEITIYGKTHRVKPTMDLIRRLEVAECGPFVMASLLHKAQPAFGTYAAFVAIILQQAGAEVTADKLYTDLTNQDRMAELYSICSQCVGALIPSRAQAEPTGEGEAKKPTTRRTTSQSGTRRRSTT